MKKVCYLILAHDNMQQVSRIIDRLSTPNSCFALHIDKKCHEPTPDFTANKNVAFCDKRLSVRWGDISLNDAIVELCRTGLNQFDARHYVLISGADYPAKSSTYIESFLNGHPTVDYIVCEPLPSPVLPWLEGGRRRLSAYALQLGKQRIATIEPRRLNFENLRQIAKTVLYNPAEVTHALRLLMFADKRSSPMPLCGGDTWWILTGSTLRAMIRFIDNNPELYNFMTDVANPDEVYLQSVARAVSPSTIVSRRMRHISWSRKGNSPRWLTMRNCNEISGAIENPDKIFIRKIKSADVCDFIDTMLLHQQ